ncbi:MAG: dephospho-CoA kinase [Candidatus Omnitrophota bacterium]
MRRRKPDKKIVLGVTGSFGSGKSTVADLFKSSGAQIIDADKIGHALLLPGSHVFSKVFRLFGSGILDKKKQIDRRFLGQLVFKNRALLKKLNSIMHPEIVKAIKRQIKKSRNSLVVLDAPLLLEAGLRSLVTKLVVVTVKRSLQIQRLQKKLPLSRKEINLRIKSQVPIRKKIQSADFIIDNNRNKNELKKKVMLIRRSLWKN